MGACDDVESQRLLQDLTKSTMDGSGTEASKWPDQAWFAAALDSPPNSKDTAAGIREELKSKDASSLRPHWYMTAYLKLMRNALAHAELGPKDEVPKLGALTAEDMRLMELCPLGFASELVHRISGALGRATSAKQQQLSNMQAPRALQQHPGLGSPQACQGTREARALRRMLVASPSSLRAHAIPRRLGSLALQRVRARMQMQVVQPKPSLASAATVV